jgi:thymidylate synthase (FAD)
MRKCEAILLDFTSLSNLVYAIRMSRDSHDKSDNLGDKDKKLISKCLQNDEGSVFEHLIYQFHLRFPRSVLQELSRHRIGISPTVKSTRFTLEELFNGSDVSDFLYETGEPAVDNLNIKHLKSAYVSLKHIYEVGAVGNDLVKQLLPEAYMTEGVYTINARALNHLFRLRNRDKVFPPFRELVQKMYEVIPNTHKFIFEKSFNNA